MNKLDEFLVAAHCLQERVDCLLGLLTDHKLLLNFLLLQFLNLGLALTFGIQVFLEILASVHHHEVIVVRVKDLVVKLIWIIVVNVMHNTIEVVLDVFFRGLISLHLVRHPSVLLLLSQLAHLIRNMTAHLATVRVKEVLPSLHSGESLLLRMSEVEVALAIIKVARSVISEQLAVREISFP